jgi:chromosome segregation ATPase
VNVQTADPSSIPLPKKLYCEYSQYDMFVYHWVEIEKVIPDEKGNFTISGLSNSTTYVVRCNYRESETSPIITGKTSNYFITLSAVDALKIKNDEMTSEIATLKEQLSEIATLKEQLRTAKLTNTRHETIIELAATQNQIEKLMVKNRSFMAEIAQLKSTITEDIEAIKRISSERDTMAAEIDRISSERDTMTEKIKSLYSERDTMAAEIERLSSEKDTMAEEIKQISLTRNTLAAEIDRMAFDREASAVEIIHISDERAKLLEEIKRISSIREKLTEEIIHISSERESLAKELTHLRRELKAKEANIAEYTATIESSKELDVAYRELVQKFDTLKQENHRIMTERDQLETTEREKRETLEAEKSVHVSTIRQLVQNINKLKEASQTTGSERYKLEQAIVRMVAREKEKEKEFKHAYEKLHTNMCEMESLKIDAQSKLSALTDKMQCIRTTAQVDSYEECIGLLRLLRAELDHSKMSYRTYFEDARNLRGQMSELMTVFGVASVSEAILKYNEFVTRRNKNNCEIIRLYSTTSGEKMCDDLESGANWELIDDMAIVAVKQEFERFTIIYNKIDAIMKIMSVRGIKIISRSQCIDFLEQVFNTGSSVCDSLITCCGFTSEDLTVTEYPKTIGMICRLIEEQKTIIENNEKKLSSICAILGLSESECVTDAQRVKDRICVIEQENKVLERSNMSFIESLRVAQQEFEELKTTKLLSNCTYIQCATDESLQEKLTQSEKLVSEMSSTIQSLNDENARLREKLKDSDECLEENEKCLHAMSNTIQTMSENNATLADTANVAEQQIAELREKLACSEQYARETAELQVELAHIKQYAQEIAKSERIMISENAELQDDVRCLELEIEELQKKLKQSDDLVEEMKRRHLNMNYEICQFKESSYVAEQEIEDLQKKLKQSEKAEDELSAKVYSISCELGDFKMMASEADQRVAELQEKLARSEKLEHEMSSTIKTMSDDNAVLKDIARVTEQQIMELQEKLARSEKLADEMSNRVCSISHDFDDFKDIVGSADQQVADLQKKLKHSEKLVSELSNTIQPMSDDNAQLRETIHKSEHKVTELCENLRISEQIVSELTQTIQSLNDDNAKLNDRIRISEQQVTNLQEKLKSSENFVSRLSFDVQHMIAENAKLEAKNDEFKKMLTSIDISFLPISDDLKYYVIHNSALHLKLHDIKTDVKKWAAYHFAGEINLRRMENILGLGDWKPEEIDTATLMILKEWILTVPDDRWEVYSKILHYAWLKC